MKSSAHPTQDAPGNERIVMSVCNSHCGGQCLLKVHVKDGGITRIETDDGPEPQLRACWRGRAQRQRVYAPDRLKYPMKRVGARGEGKFQRISWDEALDTVASEIKRVRDTYGPGAAVFRGGGGDLGLLQNRATIDRALGMSGGYSQTWGSISYEGGRWATLATFGTSFARSSRDDLLNSRLIILWGLNPADTVMDSNTCWYLARAREAGIRIICVDPKYTNTVATFAHQWIPIRPGTDSAMLIAMAYTMIRDELYDKAFLDRYTIGFEKFRDYVMGAEDGVPKTPTWAEAVTRVPAATIEALAREYATIKPAALIGGIAPGRSAYGEQYHRAAHTLAAMTGNIGVHGGDAAGRCWTAVDGFPYMKPRRGASLRAPNPVEDNAPRRKTSVSGGVEISREKGQINTSQTADAVLKGKAGGYPYEYKLLFIMTTNTLNQAPNLHKTIEAFNKLEFIVVEEQFMTATARYADILLPTNTFLERNDICNGEGVPFYGFMSKAIEPLYESKSQFEIGCLLAARLGVSGYSDKTEEQWMRDIVKESLVPDYEEFKKKGIYRPDVSRQYLAFEKEIKDPANNPFPTKSGKIEIYSQQIADMGHPKIPPIPKYVETWESLNDPLAKKYPLQMITRHVKRRAHTQFENIPWIKELEPQTVIMNTVDAEARGIKNGDMVTVFNDRGRILIQAWVTERIMPGVVDVGQGAWYDPDENGVDRSGGPNVLSNDQVSPAGAVPYNTGLVQVQKA